MSKFVHPCQVGSLHLISLQYQLSFGSFSPWSVLGDLDLHISLNASSFEEERK